MTVMHARSHMDAPPDACSLTCDTSSICQDRKEAEQMLSQSGQNGWCLVRDSLTKPGQLTLSIWLSGQPRHIRYTRVTFPYILNSPPSVPPSLSPPLPLPSPSPPFPTFRRHPRRCSPSASPRRIRHQQDGRVCLRSEPSEREVFSSITSMIRYYTQKKLQLSGSAPFLLTYNQF